jgi:citrate synthase
MSNPPTTAIATSTPDDVFVRGKSLCNELIGSMSFTEMMCLTVLGRVPEPGQVAVIDACMVALMEHGLTPTSLTTRLIYGSSPEAMQSAVAAGLLGVADRFVGTVEGCGRLLARIVASDDWAAEAEAIAQEHRTDRQPIPGFGHPFHKPDDPRTPRLLAVAREHQVAGAHTSALEQLAEAVDAAVGKHLTINATGAVAALLADCGVPAEIMRGFVLVSRCAGLVAHVHEEQSNPSMGAIWGAAEEAVPHQQESDE